VSIRFLLLTAILAGGVWSAADPARAQDATAGKKVFQSECSNCHSAEKGRNMIGPSMFDVLGRVAGKVAGFHYSPANEASGLTWDTAALDRYLANPKAIIPHTTMGYQGLKDADKRANLIAYLATLH